METKKLKRIRRAIERFFYSIKFNIALHKVFSAPRHKDLRKKIKIALEKQMIFYSKVSKVDEIVGVEKASKELTNKNLLRNLLLIWIPLSEFLNRDELNEYLIATANEGGKSALRKLNVDDNFVLENKVLIDKVNKRVDVVFKDLDKTTQSWIARTVQEGLKSKKKHADIARMIKSDAKRVAMVRADIITEHEAATVLGMVELEVYKRNGVQFHRWITSRDEKVCPKCDANESVGETPIGDAFPTGSITPPDHVRCRCFIMPVIPLDFKVKWQGK
jgi:SPP1 gp7 family putative phage head morphogenesis protein